MATSTLRGPIPADNVIYDNTQSGMTATDVQDAIDELNADLGDKSSASVVTGNDAFSKIATLNGITKNKIFTTDINSSFGSWYSSPELTINLDGDYRNRRIEWSIVSDLYTFVTNATVDSTSIKFILLRPTSATGVTGKIYVRVYS